MTSHLHYICAEARSRPFINTPYAHLSLVVHLLLLLFGRTDLLHCIARDWFIISLLCSNSLVHLNHHHQCHRALNWPVHHDHRAPQRSLLLLLVVAMVRLAVILHPIYHCPYNSSSSSKTVCHYQSYSTPSTIYLISCDHTHIRSVCLVWVDVWPLRI